MVTVDGDEMSELSRFLSLKYTKVLGVIGTVFVLVRIPSGRFLANFSLSRLVIRRVSLHHHTVTWLNNDGVLEGQKADGDTATSPVMMMEAPTNEDDDLLTFALNEFVGYDTEKLQRFQSKLEAEIEKVERNNTAKRQHYICLLNRVNERLQKGLHDLQLPSRKRQCR